MDWITPTGHEDPSGVWTDEPYAYDGSVSWPSIAITSVGALSWSGYLVLTLEPITCDQVRVYPYRPYPYVDVIRVEVFDGTDWTLVYEGSFNWEQWVYYSFTEQQVEKMRVSYYSHYGVGGKKVGLFEAALYGEPISTEGPYGFMM